MSRDEHNSETGYNRATFPAMILLERGCEADIFQSLLDGYWSPDRLHAPTGVGVKDPGPIPVHEDIYGDSLGALQGVD